MPSAADLIDLAQHPINDPVASAALLSRVRADLAADGCAVVEGFVTPEALETLIGEAHAAAPNGHRSFSRTNPYFTQDRPDLAETHPLRRFYDRSNSFVPADNFGPESGLRAIFEWAPFRDFIKAALEEENFFPYADPLADVIVNTVEEGGGFPWHFDTNNYTVTLALQNGETGGEFEYAPWLRTSTDKRYDDVEAVLDDRSDRVRRLVLKPGDLQIFKGRYALHRVTPVQGARPRYVAIFSFVEKEGMVGSPERARQLYGRVLPIHLERAGRRADALID